MSLFASLRLTPLCSVLQLVVGIPVVLLTGLSCGKRNIATDNLVRLDLVRWSYVLKKAWNLTSYFVLLSVVQHYLRYRSNRYLTFDWISVESRFFPEIWKVGKLGSYVSFCTSSFTLPLFCSRFSWFSMYQEGIWLINLEIWRCTSKYISISLIFSEIRKFGKVRSYNLNTWNTNTNNAAITLLNLQVRMKECPRQEFNLKKCSTKISNWLSKWTN